MAAVSSLRRYCLLWRLIAISSLAAACALHPPKEQLPVAQVLFVCEHGTVKSVMAASYFNQVVAKRRLPFRAVSRGIAAVTTTDLSQAARVVVIGADLPTTEDTSDKVERWDDVPAASVDYAAARDSLKAHIEELLQRLPSIK